MKKWLVMSAALVLAACGGETLSKSQVQKAIDSSAKFHSVCVPFELAVQDRHEGDLTQLGAPEILLLKRLDNGKRANLKAMEQMDALVNAGLYHQEKTVKEGEGEHTIRFLAYRLTDKGREAFMTTPHGNLLCIGKEVVEKINYFTTPTPANGLTVTQVSYEAKIQPERWAKKLVRDENLSQSLKDTLTRHATLVKTNDGWRNIKELSKR